MKLLKLKLKNFKGIKSFELDTSGGNMVVFGDNSTGKTTLFDAFLWLLFDKDSKNQAQFDIKTLDEAGNAIHGLDHEVEGALEVDGREVTLRKVYSEKWTKKRGSAERIFSGHTVDHFLDGVPVKKSEYQDYIANIADEEAFKLLTSPTYFNNLHWQKRREILLEVCGDISDEDVIGSDKTLAKLPEILGNKSIEDHRKVVLARKKEINRELERIPVRIDEVTQGLPDISDINLNHLQSDIEKLKKSRQEKQKELARIQEGGEIAEMQKRLREVEGELLDIKNSHCKGIDNTLESVRAEYDKGREKLSQLQMGVSSKQREIESNDREIARLQSKMEKLRNDWFQEDKKEFTFEQSEVCPTCGQALPEEKLEAAREKAADEFNRAKAEKLEEIQQDGIAAKQETEKLKEANADLEKAITDLSSQVKEFEKVLEQLQRDKNSLVARLGAYEETDEYRVTLKEKNAIEKAIEGLRQDKAKAAEAVQDEIDALDKAGQALEEAKTKVEQYKRGQERIEELKVEEKKLAKEFEKIEHELYLLEQFTRAKVDLLEEKINTKFKLAKFKLFDIQVNGGIQECCETTYQGVPYSTALNNGARINIGLDIINTLSEHYGFTAPIFIDNREAVTQLIETKGQLISLVVSEEDKKLRIELESETGKPQKNMGQKNLFEKEAV